MTDLAGVRRGALQAIVLMALCVGACTSKAAAPAPAPNPPAIAPGVRPGGWIARAVRIHVYGAPNAYEVSVDPKGRITSQGAPAGQPNRVIDGGWLSPAEVKDLVAGLSFGPPPIDVAACCSPRHAFLFYDKDNRYLGSLTVCFQCGCTALRPDYAPADPKTYDLHWDSKVFGRIVLAHHLGPLAPPEAGL